MNTCSTPVQHRGESLFALCTNPSVFGLQTASRFSSGPPRFFTDLSVEVQPCFRLVNAENRSEANANLKVVSRLAGNEGSGEAKRGVESTFPSLLDHANARQASGHGSKIATVSDGSGRSLGGVSGGKRLNEYLAAPESVREDFDRRLAEEVRVLTEEARYAYEREDDDPVSPELPRGKLPRRPLRWDESWRKRAQSLRAGLTDEGRSFEQEREALYGLEPAFYIETLTSETVSIGPANCFLPDHTDRNKSMWVYDSGRGWYCHTCGIGGNVYVLAGILWGLQTRGPQFREIHNRLCALFDIREAA